MTDCEESDSKLPVRPSRGVVLRLMALPWFHRILSSLERLLGCIGRGKQCGLHPFLVQNFINLRRLASDQRVKCRHCAEHLSMLSPHSRQSILPIMVYGPCTMKIWISWLVLGFNCLTHGEIASLIWHHTISLTLQGLKPLRTCLGCILWTVRSRKIGWAQTLFNNLLLFGEPFRAKEHAILWHFSLTFDFDQ